MPANFDGTTSELQPNKTTESIDNIKNEEKTSNEEKKRTNTKKKKKNTKKEEQTEQKKNKSWADCPLTDHQ